MKILVWAMTLTLAASAYAKDEKQELAKTKRSTASAQEVLKAGDSLVWCDRDRTADQAVAKLNRSLKYPQLIAPSFDANDQIQMVEINKPFLVSGFSIDRSKEISACVVLTKQ